ncbi:MAG: ABC transporter ATP-binding protein/permease [Desulfurococcales archaeon]|nr:ABC transporter ATP-binding protein/permease [Desulfurococcales archaeon]
MSGRSSASLLVRFVREAFTDRKILLIIAVSIAGSSLSTLASPYLLKIAIDEYIIPGRYEKLPLIAFLYLLALVGQWLFMTLQTYYVEVFGQRVLRRLRASLEEKVLRARLDFFAERSTGDLVSRLINDTNLVNDVLVSGLLGGIGSMLSVVGIVAAMLILDVRLTLATLSTVPLMVFIAKYFGGRIRRAYRETRKRIAKLSSIVEETVSGIETVRSFGRERMVEEEFDRASRETISAFMRVARYMGVFWPLMNLATLASISIVIGYGAYLAYTGAATVGVVVAFVQYAQRIRGPINNVVSMYDSLQSALASLERIYEVLDDPRVEDDEGIRISRLRGDIAVENVWFWYPGRRDPALRGVSLHIRPGERVALVGHTGAGKTTLANLLMRFYDPQKGRILYDGIDSRSISRRSLRSRIGYVPQETYLFPGTIMENIKLGKPDAGDEDVVRVCKELGIHEFIMRLPRGYQTPAGEAGRLLSVGEKQLISIARAMLRDPDIVILDEALSSVDPKTESRVLSAMAKLMAGRTSIIIAHRLAVTRLADKVVVLEGGRIVEEGPPRELLERRGAFYRLYTSQEMLARG